jgi:hypothetical protein
MNTFKKLFLLIATFGSMQTFSMQREESIESARIDESSYKKLPADLQREINSIIANSTSQEEAIKKVRRLSTVSRSFRDVINTHWTTISDHIRSKIKQ